MPTIFKNAADARKEANDKFRSLVFNEVSDAINSGRATMGIICNDVTTDAVNAVKSELITLGYKCKISWDTLFVSW